MVFGAEPLQVPASIVTRELRKNYCQLSRERRIELGISAKNSYINKMSMHIGVARIEQLIRNI